MEILCFYSLYIFSLLLYVVGEQTFIYKELRNP